METADEEQLRVAKMVIVAWIKDWSCYTLYQAVSGKRKIEHEDLKALCEKYKFLPSDWFWYHRRPKGVKKFIADLDRRLNNALWDTEDNMKKLGFASYLVKLDALGIQSSSKYDKEDKAKHAIDRKKFRADVLATGKHKEHAQKMNGTHWTTVK